MPHVVFYQLTAADGSVAHKAAHLIADAYAQKKRIVVLCQDQHGAEQVDELLWQLPADRFVPHNLYNEGPGAGTPVEICWHLDQLSPRALLVNVSQQRILRPDSFNNIIDFVPVEEAAKQAARVRYKEYQKAGCAMQFKSA